MDYTYSALALYLGIGALISLVGGAFRKRTAPRPVSVALVQICALVFLWLPLLMWQAAKGTEVKPSE